MHFFQISFGVVTNPSKIADGWLGRRAGGRAGVFAFLSERSWLTTKRFFLFFLLRDLLSLRFYLLLEGLWGGGPQNSRVGSYATVFIKNS